MTNPAIHFFRGLRHRNLAAIRHAAQRGLHQLHQPHHPSPQNVVDGSEIQRSRAQPLIIQGLRTNPKDQESHVLFFDIEALVGKFFFLAQKYFCIHISLQNICDHFFICLLFLMAQITRPLKQSID